MDSKLLFVSKETLKLICKFKYNFIWSEWYWNTEMKNVNRNFENFMNKSKVDNSEKEKVLISFIHYQITEWITLDGGGGCYKMFWKEKKVRSQVSLNWSQLNIWWCAYQCFARMEHWDLNLHCWYGSVQHSTHSERENAI